MGRNSKMRTLGFVLALSLSLSFNGMHAEERPFITRHGERALLMSVLCAGVLGLMADFGAFKSGPRADPAHVFGRPAGVLLIDSQVHSPIPSAQVRFSDLSKYQHHRMSKLISADLQMYPPGVLEAIIDQIYVGEALQVGGRNVTSVAIPKSKMGVVVATDDKVELRLRIHYLLGLKLYERFALEVGDEKIRAMGPTVFADLYSKMIVSPKGFWESVQGVPHKKAEVDNAIRFLESAHPGLVGMYYDDPDSLRTRKPAAMGRTTELHGHQLRY